MPVPPDEEAGGSQIIFEIRVARLGQGSARRARACNLNDPTEVMGPVVGTGGSVLYATRYEGACFGTTITRSSASGSRTLKVALPQQLPPEETISLAGSSDRLFLGAAGAGPMTIYDLGKPDFGLGTLGSLCP